MKYDAAKSAQKTLNLDKRNKSLFKIREKTFSEQDINSLANEITMAKGLVDVNERIASEGGRIYSHPPLYYATVSSNLPAIKKLQNDGAKYSKLSAGELYKLKSTLSQEVNYLLEPQDPTELLSKEAKEIEVSVSSKFKTEAPALIDRQLEIEKRKQVLKYVDKLLAYEIQQQAEVKVHSLLDSSFMSNKKERIELMLKNSGLGRRSHKKGRLSI